MSNIPGMPMIPGLPSYPMSIHNLPTNIPNMPYPYNPYMNPYPGQPTPEMIAYLQKIYPGFNFPSVEIHKPQSSSRDRSRDRSKKSHSTTSKKSKHSDRNK